MCSSVKKQQVLLRACDQDGSSMTCHEAVTKERVTYTYSGEKESNHGYGKILILQRRFRWSCLVPL